MFLKRLAAFFVALFMLVQLTACKQQPLDTLGSSSITAESQEEIYNQSALSGGSQNTDNSHQDNSSDRITDNTASSNGEQSSNNSQSTVSKAETSSDSSSQDKVNSEQGGNVGTTVSCNHTSGDPYQNVNKSEFYANYEPACCNLDATYRSEHGLLSGSFNVPDQYAVESQNRPQTNGKYVRNTATAYLDNGNTYVVIDSNGNEVMRVHRAGGYITLEEVAAYMYAFGGDGTIPANYTSKKSGKPASSIWGEYLRVNHSYFIGDTDKYPYEPELPDISGCGGSLRYYEMDIGTTGTVTPGYAAKPYIENNKINRGAARIVYARQDLNGNGVYENNEVYVFYTHNHYNDFREYLNYYGGWGEMFGNITGGGEYSSKTNANPTPYVPTAYEAFGM